MVRYSFLVRLSHPLLHTGLSKRSLNYLVRPIQQRLRNYDTDLLGGLEVDHQLKFRRLLDRQIAGLGTFENFVHVISYAPVVIREVPAVGHEATSLYSFSAEVHRR